MIITSPELEQIDFWSHPDLPANPKKIGIALSGGADSAALLVLLCEYFKKDVTIIPATQDEPTFIDASPITKQIVEIVRARYPNITIKDPVQYVEHKQYGYYGDWVAKFHLEYDVDVMVGGVTLAPQQDVSPFDPDLIKHNQRHFEIRDPDTEKMNTAVEYTTTGLLFHFPFKRVTKKFIAFLYDKFDMMDTIYPLTVSCVRMYRDNTPDGPCKECFWCHEKYWAFGSYDGGVQ